MLSRVKDRLSKSRAGRRFGRLLHMLQEPDRDIRVRAVEELGQMGDPRAIELLTTELQDQDTLVRYTAIGALGMLGDPRAIEPLRAAYITEADEYNRLWIAVELIGLGDARPLDHLFAHIAAVDAEGQEDWDSAVIIAATVAGLGDHALGPLSDAINHPNRTVRWIAVLALGELHDARARAALMHALHDADPGVRAEAAGALHALGTE